MKMIPLHDCKNMRESIIEWIKSFYWHTIAGERVFDAEKYNDQAIFWAAGMFIALVAVSIFMWLIARFILLRIVHSLAVKTSETWDDRLVENKVFRSLAHIVPLMCMEYMLSIVFYQYPNTAGWWEKLTFVLIVYAIIITLNRALNALQVILSENSRLKDKPIQSYIQVIKIVSIGILVILLLSILTNRSPLFFLTSLGAMAAILVLIFKDTILGFIGSIQLAANDMIRIGDWVTMEKYGADGDVEAITLSTVKIRNFDRTITTIPTYAFIADSFRNWRGMEESDGRRIKRPVLVQIESVKFASEEMIEHLKSIQFYRDFVEKRQAEIQEYNERNGLVGERAINARRMTNLGLFRKYLEYYLRNHPLINQKMTLMVRQLEPKEFGVPIEIYCFSKSKVWEDYENLQADIFDHVFAVIHYFELAVFERPSGRNFQMIRDKEN